MASSRTPEASRLARACSRIERSPTGTSGLGSSSVSGRRRVPKPAQRMIAEDTRRIVACANCQDDAKLARLALGVLAPAHARLVPQLLLAALRRIRLHARERGGL